MAQAIVNFNELPITNVVKHGMRKARRNAKMVFIVAPRSIFAEFPLANSMKPFWVLKGKADQPLRLTSG